MSKGFYQAVIHVTDQVRDVVGVDVLRTIGLSVAALIQGDHTIACRRQHLDLMPRDRIPEERVAVEQYHQRTLPFLHVVQLDVADGRKAMVKGLRIVNAFATVVFTCPAPPGLWTVEALPR